MHTDTRTCAQCEQSFTVFPEDKTFYEKMHVPPPTLCLFCRRQHLLAWRNQRTLYARTCDKTGKSIISVFAPGTDYTVYDRDYWWSDAWDPLEYGQNIDFSKTFAEQFDTVMRRVPMVAIFNGKSENSPYCNHAGVMKNSYLTHASWDCERSLYSDLLNGGKDLVDCLQCTQLEQGYQLVNCDNCYNSKYSSTSTRCNDSWFLYDCKNCSDCIGCVNLSNKQYYIFNQAYSKEEYQKKMRELQLDTREGILNVEHEFQKLLQRTIHRYAHIAKSQDATGNFLVSVNNARYCFSLNNTEDSNYCINGGMVMKDTYDGYGVGAVLERGYYILDTGDKGMENMFCGVVWGSQFVYYSYNCHSSYELFGCTGVRGKKFCILNKQYSEDEYKTVKGKLIAHMKETGEWGEFFPPSVSPFGYNETLAMEYTPLQKEEALARGFKWQHATPGTYGKETMKPDMIPSTIAETNDDIVQHVLACIACNKNYKIIKQELDFYRQHHLPVPTQCPDCRYYERLKLRGPHQLWDRSCHCRGHASERDVYQNANAHPHGNKQCRNTFATIYAPERKEIVYCKECYQAETI